MKKVRYFFLALGAAVLGVLVALGAAACGNGKREISLPAPSTGEVLVIVDGMPEAALGKVGDICLTRDGGTLWRKATETSWERVSYREYRFEGDALVVTFSDDTVGRYVMAAASEEGGCDHANLGELYTVYPAYCVVPGIGVRTCTDCGESFAEVIPANGEHEYEPGQAECVLCGGAPNYFYQAVEKEPEAPTPWAPDGYFLIENVPEAALSGGRIEVPGEIKGLPVVIGSDAFTSAEKAELTNVELDEGVVGIEANAFAGCSNLTSLQLPETLKFIGESAFSGTSGLAIDLNIPSKVETIGYGAFQGSGITSVTIPASVTSLGNTWTAENVNATAGSDFNNEALQWIVQTYTTYVIEEDEILIGSVFANTQLTKVEFAEGSNLKTIPHGCFYGCERLELVTLPDSVEVIGEGAFGKCNLRTVELPDSVKTVLNAAFAGNEHLNHLGIGKNVEALGLDIDVSQGALAACYPELAEIPAFLFDIMVQMEVPGYPEVLKPTPFENCYRLVEIENRSSSVTITADGKENPGGIGKYARVLGVISGEGESRLSEQSADEGTYTVYTADDGKVYVVDYISEGGEILDLASTFGTGYVVHDYAISNCLDFASVDLNGCSEVGNYAFSREPNTLNSFTNPIAKLRTVTFGTDIAFIGAHAFYNCIGLSEVDLFDCKNLTSISDYAFAADKDIYDQTLTYNNVFNLDKVYLGENIETIGEGAFECCRALLEVYIGTKTENVSGNTSKLSRIGKNAFMNTFIGHGNNNKHVYFSGTLTQWAACVREAGQSFVFGPSDKGTSIKIHCSDGSTSV